MSFNVRMGALRGAVDDWKRDPFGRSMTKNMADAASACGSIERDLTIDYLTPFTGAKWARVLAAPDESWSVCCIARAYLDRERLHHAGLLHDPAHPMPALPPWPAPSSTKLWKALTRVWEVGAVGTPQWRFKKKGGPPMLVVVEGIKPATYINEHLCEAIIDGDIKPIAFLITELRSANDASAGWLAARLRAQYDARLNVLDSEVARTRLADLIDASVS